MPVKHALKRDATRPARVSNRGPPGPRKTKAQRVNEFYQRTLAACTALPVP